MPRQIPLDLPHRPSLARDDLIVSQSNRLAVEAIDRWPDWRHPVVLVVGPPGSGKTHLAAAWRELAQGEAAKPGEAERLLATAPFCVTIDDIDRSDMAAAELFTLVNAARLGAGAVLATSRTHPAQLPNMLPDLRSRLQAATTIELAAPDDALLVGVLAKLFADRQLAVDPRHLDDMIARMRRSLDEARIIVAEIDREALAAKGRVTRALLRRVFEARERRSGGCGHESVATTGYADGMED